MVLDELLVCASLHDHHHSEHTDAVFRIAMRTQGKNLHNNVTSKEIW